MMIRKITGQVNMMWDRERKTKEKQKKKEIREARVCV